MEEKDTNFNGQDTRGDFLCCCIARHFDRHTGCGLKLVGGCFSFAFAVLVGNLPLEDLTVKERRKMGARCPLYVYALCVNCLSEC